MSDAKIQDKVVEEHMVKMKKPYSDEQNKASKLDQSLVENHEKNCMLSQGTNDLDKILSIGQTLKINIGLGYIGIESSTIVCIRAENCNLIKETN